MVEVRLHGPLAKQFGMTWVLDISTPLEAVAAIDANRPGFRRKIMELADLGMVFRVRTRDHDYDSEDVGTTLGNCRRLDIIPVVLGASAGVRFVVGAVLVIVGVYTGNATLIQAGATLMIGAVVEWLTPQPKKEDFKNNGLQSWTISGPNNLADQGLPVPIIYGEVLTGGYPISAGLSVSQLDSAGSTSPAAFIGGNLDVMFGVSELDENTIVLQLSASAFNLDEPFSWTWSYSGFTGATSVTDDGLTKATLRVHVTATDLDAETGVRFDGSVTLVINGIQPGTGGAEAPVARTATVTRPVSVTFMPPPSPPGGL